MQRPYIPYPKLADKARIRAEKAALLAEAIRTGDVRVITPEEYEALKKKETR